MRPIVMGILNVTPDSFSDGGLFLRKEDALRYAEELVKGGADIIDVGGESSRPGAEPVPLEEELNRVVPVVKYLKQNFQVRISVDTVKPEVAEAALEAGATLINDISGGADIKMAALAKQPGVEIILMHMRGTPVTMQIQPFYPKGVLEEVRSFLTDRVRVFEEAGVTKDKIWIDPGIGFGKTPAHNLELIRRVGDLKSISPKIAIGTSRKSFIPQVVGEPQLLMEERCAPTIASSLYAYTKGASLFRVHDVAEFRRALKMWEALENVGQS